MTTGLSRRRRRGDAAFNPSGLFANGEVGVWYDPSDLTPEKLAWVAANPGFTSAQFLAAFPTHTLYQTADGTPVTALGQSVGFALDKSQGGGAIGATVITNGTFSADSDWTKGTGWSIGSGVATKTAGSASVLSQSVTVTAGQRYILRYVLTRTAGSIAPQLTGGSTVSGTARSAAGTYIEYLTAVSGNVSFEFSADASFAGTVDNVSLLAVPAGNHAVQATTAARPTLQARSNLLTYSEQFDNAAWTKTSATISANTTVAPDGTTTADTLTATAGTGVTPRFTDVSIVTASGSVYSVSIFARAGAYSFVQIYLNNQGAEWANYTLTGSGTAIANGSCTATIADVGNSWYRLTMTYTAGGTDRRPFFLLAASGTATRAQAWNPVGTETVVFWGAQLELGTTASTYQRVVTATDYADVGLPRSFTFDGIDDSFVTAGNVNFSGTDKMTVCAGVFKQTDAATGVVAELSAIAASNNGSFAIFQPLDASVGTSTVFIRGTENCSRNYTSAAPITTVTTASASIAGANRDDCLQVRQNGVTVSTVSGFNTAAGTGNFGTYQLFIGRRNQATLPFNGRIHQLIVRGAATDSVTIQQTERFVAQKTGVVL